MNPNRADHSTPAAPSGTQGQGSFDAAFWDSIQKLSAEIVARSHERGQQLAVQAQGIAKELREAYDGITDEGFKRVARRGF
ncbi:MAG TPA: hypothetical protein VGE56_02175 [Rhodocyclaceae bacterium]